MTRVSTPRSAPPACSRCRTRMTTAGSGSTRRSRAVAETSPSASARFLPLRALWCAAASCSSSTKVRRVLVQRRAWLLMRLQLLRQSIMKRTPSSSRRFGTSWVGM
jgi:hypothetical protein